MALDFPTGVPGGTTWEDDCGNEWVYDSTDNKWTIHPPTFDFPDVDPDSIWARTGTTITPINAGDTLNMGTQNAEIDINNFPEKT
jgi:hypothetical protein